jgi:RHS repeat-associated protein
LIELRSENRPELAEAYQYDASGNIIEMRQGNEVVGMSYDSANQLISRTDANGTVEFVYDSAGRLIEERQGSTVLASYEYGYLDKVISVTRGATVTRFHYNARGMMVGKERNGRMIETMSWDGIALLAKGDTVYANESHISGGTPLLSVNDEDSTFFDHDYLGTTTAAYSADGQTDVKLIGSLGKGSEDSETRFTGKSFDEDLGAHVFPFRNYRSDAGRWTSADPAGFPDGPNQHFYAPVPTSGLDPLGLWSTLDFMQHYFFGKAPYAKGAGVDFATTGNLGALISFAASGTALTDLLAHVDGTINGKWSGSSFTESGVFSKVYNYEPAVFVVGNTMLEMNYDVSVSAQSTDPNKWEYIGSFDFTIDDRYEDAIDYYSWFPGNQDYPGAAPFDIYGTWTLGGITGAEK